MNADGRPPSPIKFRCSHCRTDADSDTLFHMHAVGLAPASDLGLFAITCEACGTDADVAMWPLDERQRAALADAAPFPEWDALLERYARRVDTYRRQIAADQRHWLAAEDPEYPFVDVDLQELDLEWPLEQYTERPIGIPMAALAAVRGARAAVEAAEPDVTPQVRLLLGHLTYILSRDSTRQEPWPRAIHLSVSRVAALAPTPIEQHLALALSFRPEEVPFLRVQPGQYVPVMHVFLGEAGAD